MKARQQTPHVHTADPGVLAALTGRDAQRDRRLSLRTRRAVYLQVQATRTDRAQGRRNLSIAVLIIGTLLLLLMPIIWSGVQEVVNGATYSDTSILLLVLGVMLVACVAAILFLLGDDRRASQGVRQR